MFTTFLILILLILSTYPKTEPTNFSYAEHGKDWGDQCQNGKSILIKELSNHRFNSMNWMFKKIKILICLEIMEIPPGLSIF